MDETATCGDDMRVAVTGGTGTLGREVVRTLVARGHDVRALSRHAAARPVDLTTGEGLAAALEGVDVVIDAANAGPGRRAAENVLLAGTQRLLDAAAQAGVAHHVGVSIIGVDRVPYTYYAVKLAQEAVVRGGRVPWTIVRATQFHTEVDRRFSAAARAGLLPGAEFLLQPVDLREVAVVLADTVEAEPSLAITQFAGPEVRNLRELAQTWRDATGSRAVIVPVPLFGPTARALRAGGLTNRGAWTGRGTFAAYLRDRMPGISSATGTGPRASRRSPATTAGSPRSTSCATRRS
jgi:uncharacterized protein YbjT (DUF2867 family)